MHMETAGNVILNAIETYITMIANFIQNIESSSPPTLAELEQQAQQLARELEQHVKLVPLLLQQNPPPALLPGELEPPPPNPWVPTAFTPASRATAVRLGYRFDAGLEDDDPADRPGGRGFGRLQLPGCVDLTEVAASWRGSKLALADVLCSEGSDRKPFATAAVQLCSDRPAAATTTARQRARAELWRMTLLQALSSSTAAAARAGLKVDVSFNARGVRLLVSGYAQRLPQMVD